MDEEKKTCEACEKVFTIGKKDRELYAQLKVAPPLYCPRCGVQKMMALRNERILYKRACDKCKKDTLSIYHSSAPYTVYCHECWWGDSWDGGEYKMEYDKNRNLLDQVNELQHKVPREALIILNSTNCDYGNNIRDSKDCYFSFLIANSENILYSTWFVGSKDCFDCQKVVDSELVAHSVDVVKCYKSAYLQDCSDSSECYFSYDLRGCSNCLFSSNLRNATYRIENIEYTKDEYSKKLKEIMDGKYTTLQESIKKYNDLKKSAIRKYVNQINSSGVTGNYLQGCAKSEFCFEAISVEDTKAVASILNSKNTEYGYAIGVQPTEFIFGSSVIKGGSNIRYSYNLFNCSHCIYCDSLISCKDCIGCVGIKKKEYCILNTEYTKENYERIYKELQENGELKNFPSPAFSTFAYNETAAEDYYPASKEKAISIGYRWQDETTSTKGQETLTPENIKDSIMDVDESIIREVLKCTDCGRNYRIVKRELEFCKNFLLPISRTCPQCRFKGRRTQRLPFDLWNGNCKCNKSDHGHEGLCKNSFETSYAPDRPETIYCEECYQKEVI